MTDFSSLSKDYEVRRLDDADAEDILALCAGNPQFYQYSEARLSGEQVLEDLHITPPGVASSAKAFLGFYRQGALIAVMDLIDGYPEPDMAFLGFFMLRKDLQGRQIGSAIIRETAAFLKAAGKTAIRLGIDKGNPQSAHFWKKNGFLVCREVDRGGHKILVAEKTL